MKHILATHYTRNVYYELAEVSNVNFERFMLSRIEHTKEIRHCWLIRKEARRFFDEAGYQIGDRP